MGDLARAVLQELRDLQNQSEFSFTLEVLSEDPLELRVSSPLENRASIEMDFGREDLIGLDIGQSAHLEIPSGDDLNKDVIELMNWVEGILKGDFEETIQRRGELVVRGRLEIVVNGEVQRVRYSRGMSNPFKTNLETKIYHYSPYPARAK